MTRYRSVDIVPGNNQMDQSPMLREPPTLLPDIINASHWFDVIKFIDHEVRTFRDHLITIPSLEHRPGYIIQWLKFVLDATEHYNKNPDATWQTVSNLLHVQPIDDFRSFIELLLDKVRPLKHIITIWDVTGYAPRNQFSVQLNPNAHETPALERMKEIHVEIVETEKVQREINEATSLSETFSSPSLLQIEKDMDAKLANATRDLKSDIASLNNTMATSIAEAIARALGDAKTSTKELQDETKRAKAEAIKIEKRLQEAVGTTRTEANKIDGRIKNVRDSIDTIRADATIIQVNAEAASDKAKKVLLEAKQDLDTARDQVHRDCKGAISVVEDQMGILNATYKKVKKLHKRGGGGGSSDDSDDDISSDSSNGDKPKRDRSYQPRNGGGEWHTIAGTKYQVRGKKFCDDETDLQCHGDGHYLIFYELLRSIAQQYGILITALHAIEKWDTDRYETNPTCPYDKEDFSTDEHFTKCYNMMSMAIANKLKKVSFGTNYAAADLAINAYNKNDGYDMLWKLMQQAHPELKRDKSSKPRVPNFEGNFPEYIHKYKSYICYNANRSRPIIYDDDEIAQDIINGIKRSPHFDALRKGIKEADDKLDTWRNNESLPFPHELQLDNIANTILLYYMERNQNPLRHLRGRGRTRHEDDERRRDAHRRDHDREQPAIRAAYYNSGGNRQNSHSRGNSYNSYRNRNPSRSNSYSRGRSNSRDGDNRRQYTPQRERDRGNGPANTACTICGTRHLPSTVGCPSFMQYMNIRDHVDRSNPDELRRQFQNMERERSQSRPPSRGRNTSRDSRQRSNSSDRSYRRGGGQ